MTIRLIIDLQAIQTQSRRRGIGRYSLEFSLAIGKHVSEMETILVLNSSLPIEDEFLKSIYQIYKKEQVVFFTGIQNIASINSPSLWRMHSADIARSTFIESLRPDVIHTHSIFEGYGEDVVLGNVNNIIQTCTLYDIIPYLNQDMYLQDSGIRKWYYERLNHLKVHDHLFSISQSSRQEVIDNLHVRPDVVTTIGSGLGEWVRSYSLKPHHQAVGDAVPPRFVLYTGGIDPRKNINRLIEAFSLLNTQNLILLIVCKINDDERRYYDNITKKLKLSSERVKFLGYVSDHRLRLLYEQCALFVFPSLHEGLGLPVLEAMACGAPVLASRIPSMQSLVDDDRAMFDPYSPKDIADCISRAVRDPDFLMSRRNAGFAKVKQFSWETTAGTFGDKVTELVSKRRMGADSWTPVVSERPKLAMVTPWPPDASGIADYAKEMYELLSEYYDITIVTESEIGISRKEKFIITKDKFIATIKNYDRVVYMLGGSLFHRDMIELIESYPGTVVAHDFFIGNLFHAMDALGYAPGVWASHLYGSHGWPAVWRRFTQAPEIVYSQWPCNGKLLRHANGVIVHSAHAQSLARQWFGAVPPGDWLQVPLLRLARQLPEKREARELLGIPHGAFVVSSFGSVATTKMTDQVLDGFGQAAKMLGQSPYLLIVGDSHPGDFGALLQEKARRLSKLGWFIKLVGRVSHDAYTAYLSATDVAVQLRMGSRGETSAAVLDCMSAGLPTIVNAHGSSSELPSDSVCMISDSFDVDELSEAMVRLFTDVEVRRRLSSRAKRHVVTCHGSANVKQQMRSAIETFAVSGPRVARFRVIRRLIDEAGLPRTPGEWREIAYAIGSNETHCIDQTRSLYLEVPGGEHVSIADLDGAIVENLNRIVRDSVDGCRIEPVVRAADGTYFTAVRLMYDVIGTSEQPFPRRSVRLSTNAQLPSLADVSRWDEIIKLCYT